MLVYVVQQQAEATISTPQFTAVIKCFMQSCNEIFLGGLNFNYILTCL